MQVYPIGLEMQRRIALHKNQATKIFLQSNNEYCFPITAEEGYESMTNTTIFK